MNVAVKILLLLVTFFACALVQVSFVSYFSIAGAIPSLVFVLFFLCMFFDESKNYVHGLVLCVVAGFFLDVMQPTYFGISMAALFLLYVTYILLSHLLRQYAGSIVIVYFACGFALFLLAYDGLLWLSARLFSFDFYMTESVLLSVVYSLPFALLGFLVAQKFLTKKEPVNQLRLF